MKIFDDALPSRFFERAKKEIIMNPSFPFYVTNTGDYRDPLASCSCVILHNDHWYWEFFFNLFELLCDKCNVEYGELIRVRIGLIFRDLEPRTNLAHIDSPDVEGHKVALLYLSDSDAPTVLYNERYEYGTSIENYPTEQFTVKRTVLPKENRVVWFDGDTFHSSATPINSQTRYTINFNYV